MSLRFDSTQFGEVVINGQIFGDVLIVGEKIIPRDRAGLQREFGTDHLVSIDEAKLLLEGNPEVVIVGTGQSGILSVETKIKEKFEKKGIRFEEHFTPQAISRYNFYQDQGRRVNALLHTTC